MEAVATTGVHGISISNNSLQGMLKDEVKIAFDNATGNEIFARKYKVKKSAEGRVGCIVKRCPSSLQGIHSLHTHCLNVHEISFSFRGEFIFHIKLEQRQINVFDMSSEDARSIKYLPESVSVNNDCAKAAGIIEESSSSKDNNDLQYILKDEVINAFENYIDDNHYGCKYKISIVDNKYECIIKECDRSYKVRRSWQTHCSKHHNIRVILRNEYIIAIEEVEQEKPPVCIICNKKSKNKKALRDHHSKTHGIKCKRKDGLLLPIMKTSNKLSKIYGSDTGKIQDNTNATKATTDNMDSNRKRSHFLGRCYEESNAKKAKLNPLDFSDRFLESITADDSFVTPATGNIDSINTAFQFSTTPSSISDNCVESNFWPKDFLDSIIADSLVVPTASDNAPINTDSQSYATPIVISDDNVTFSS